MGLKQFLSCLVLVWLAASSVAHAADPEADSKRLYKEGTKHYNLGEFEEAVTAYKSGYDAKPDPVFLFNIAQAYRLWNKPDKAIFFYKSFLRNLPEAPNRPEVERRIAEMQTELDKQSAQKQEPEPINAAPVTAAPTTPPPPLPMAVAPPEPTDGTTLKDTATPTGDAPIYKQWWFWTAIGAVALGTVAVIAVSSGGGSAAPKADFPVTKVF
ncbi:MAG: hypothetical protein SF187_05225 [Deltaproteobacteria bacterium]|nr:hypothetical protein [Deltaproteobacteria bacterium]